MEAEVKRNFNGLKVVLIEGSGGIFDVELDGTVLFSKNKADCGSRFPNEGEITELIRARTGA